VNEINVAELKARQDARQARTRALLEQYVGFRDDFVGAIQQFTSDAITAGLQGVVPCTVQQLSEQVLQVKTTMDGWDLLFLAIDQAFGVEQLEEGRPQGADGNCLCAKILAFRGSDLDLTPAYEVVLYDAAGAPRSYGYYARWRSVNGWRWVIPCRPLQQGSGRFAAEMLIRHEYSFKATMKETVTLGALLRGRSGAPPLGFVLQRHDGE
jgi:hypothetical protein